MLASFLWTCLLIELTPGPNMTWLALLSASHGRLAGLAAVAGISSGLAIAGAAAMLGVATLIAASPAAFTALRWAGSLYLLYLAWDALRGKEPAYGEATDGVGRFFMQGLTSNILNPKAYLFYAAMLPQFIASDAPFAASFGLLAALYVTVATGVHAAIAVFAGSLGKLIGAGVESRAVRVTFAFLLAATAIWFFVSSGANAR